MRYKEGRQGRVFVLKFEHGDDFQKEITDFCRQEAIHNGYVQFIGAVRKGEFVAGPKKPEIPPDPVWKSFDDARETTGYGTIFWDEEGPRVHMHGVFSRPGDCFIGCIRKKTEVYLIIEAIIVEITGINIRRVYNNETGLKTMEID